MKPVNKGETITGFTKHGQAKPELINRLGAFCSYCECEGSPTQLHVEHIYPAADAAHPGLATNWKNFLLACNTCNIYKRLCLGDGRQTGLLRRCLWPHLDNTFRAFDYHPDGRVTIKPGLSPALTSLAEFTRDMVGLMRSPASAQDYQNLGIAYDGVRRRGDAWRIAENALASYLENPSTNMLRTVQDNCLKTGYFSVWMEVFRLHPIVRQALIEACQAAPECFDATTQPIARGRI